MGPMNRTLRLGFIAFLLALGACGGGDEGGSHSDPDYQAQQLGQLEGEWLMDCVPHTDTPGAQSYRDGFQFKIDGSVVWFGGMYSDANCVDQFRVESNDGTVTVGEAFGEGLAMNLTFNMEAGPLEVLTIYSLKNNVLRLGEDFSWDSDKRSTKLSDVVYRRQKKSR